MDYSDVDAFTYPFQLTKTIHRQMYPFLEPSRDTLSASGKTVLITGASQGIGEVIARAWCMAKAEGVLITARNKANLDRIADELRGISPSTKVVVQTADLTVETDVQELFKVAAAEFGNLDVLINSGGALTPGKVGELEPSAWLADIETNVKGLYLLTHYFLKFKGEARGGTLINLGTGAAGINPPGMSSYLTGKIAQQKMLEIVQVENPDLRAFTLIPGLPLTKMTLPHFHYYAKDDCLLSGGLSLYLATPQADWLKGQTVSINWDIEEMEHNKEAITSGRLTQLAWLNAKLQKGGHPFSDTL